MTVVNVTKSKMFFILSLVFIGGVFSASFLYPREFDVFYIYIILVLAVMIGGLFYKKPAMIAGFFILFFVFGFWITENKLEKLANASGSDMAFSGKVEVIKEPEFKDRYQNLVIKAENQEKYLLRTGIFPEYNYGDILSVNCKLEIPKNNEKSNFNYRMYLAKDSIFYLCNNPEIKNMDRNEGNKFYAGILKIKDKLNGNIMRLMPSPQSGLLSGLLIGGDNLLSKDYQNYFSTTGTTHIVAVSGYNVTIIAEYLMILGIFLGLWRKQAFWFAVTGIILFVVLVGMPSSAVRAGVMGILLIWAVKNGRLGNAQNAVLFAAVVMLFINPLLLRWDIGFQLSFLATLGIVYVYPICNDFIIKKTPQWGVSTIIEILFLTLAAQVFVLPVLFVNFGKLSLISPLANVLILPIIPLTMLLGFAAVFFSFIFAPLSQVMAWLAFLPLKYETIVIKFLANIKYAAVDISNFSWLAVVLWYIILGGGIMIIKRKMETNRNA